MKKRTNVIHVAEVNDDDIQNDGMEHPGEKPERNSKSAKSRYWLESDSVSTGEIDIEETQLYQLLKIIFRYMQYCGLFYINDSFQKKKKKKRSIFPKIYCVCLSLLVTANFLRSLSGYSFKESFGNVLLFKLLISCWWLECSTKAINCFINSYQKNRIFTFIVQFEKSCTEMHLDRYRKWIRKWMFKTLFEATFFAMFNVVGTAYAMFAVPELDILLDAVLAPISADSHFVLVMKGFNVFMQLVNSLVAMIPLAFYKVICLILYKEFSLLSKDFSTRIDDDGTFHGNFEDIRMRHQEICKLTEAADSMFNFFIAAAYSANTPMLCILLYDIMYGQLHAAQMILLIFWLIFTLGHMTMISIFGALVNYTAHAPISDVYSIHVQSTSTDRQLQMNMFLNKLTGTSIGLTALELFVINKPTMLTIIGMLLTYFVVLIQFRAPTATVSCNCNIGNITQVQNATV